jgi:hypothetical protein
MSGATPLTALLLRGQANLHGCDAAGLEMQRVASASMVTMLIEPLEAHGHTVHLYATVSNCSECSAAGSSQLSSSSALFAGRAFSMMLGLCSSHQPDNVRETLDWFLRVADAPSYDFLIMTRWDVRLLSPITLWGCSPLRSENRHRVGFAQRCEQGLWGPWACTHDILHVVSRTRLRAFSRAVGVRLNGSHYKHCCFHVGCWLSSGHGCLNMINRYALEEEQPSSSIHGARSGRESGNESGSVRGVANSYCWPPPSRLTNEANRFFQCCRKGEASPRNAVGAERREAMLRLANDRLLHPPMKRIPNVNLSINMDIVQQDCLIDEAHCPLRNLEYNYKSRQHRRRPLHDPLHPHHPHFGPRPLRPNSK